MESEGKPQKRKYIRTAPTKDYPLGFRKDGTPKVRRTPAQKKAGIEVVKIRPKLYRREKTNTYLKYHTIVMEWATRESDLSLKDLGLLFFMYNEDIFDAEAFNRYASFTSSMNYQKLNQLRKLGWVKVFKSHSDRRRSLYELSRSGKRLVAAVYAKLNGTEKISYMDSVNKKIGEFNVSQQKYVTGALMLNNAVDGIKEKKTVPMKKQSMKAKDAWK